MLRPAYLFLFVLPWLASCSSITDFRRFRGPEEDAATIAGDAETEEAALE